MDYGLKNFNDFSTLLHVTEVSANGKLLLNYLNLTLIAVLLNNDDNPNLTETMNMPNSAAFMVTMEEEVQTLIGMKTFVVVDKESWIRIIYSV